MGQSEDLTLAEPAAARSRPPRWRIAVYVGLGILAAALLGLWLTRNAIADRAIAGQLRSYGIPATYKLVSVGPRREVLADVVLGDPAHPDLTIERLTVFVNPRFGIPTLGRMIVERPRLYGIWHGGKPSFGTLDKVLFGGPKRAFRLPALDLAIHDGRALVVSDYGPVGIKVEGQGKLRDGFTGIIAASAPRLAGRGCTADRASLYGAVKIAAERPAFDGPLRAAALDCPRQALALRGAAMQLQALIDRSFDGVEGVAGLTTGAADYGGRSARRLKGRSQFTWRGGDVTATYRLGAGGVRGGELGADGLALSGTARTRDAYRRIDLDGDVAGVGLRLGSAIDGALGQGIGAGKGTLIAPLLAQMRTALAREAPGSRMAGSYIVRRTGGVLSLNVPRASLTGRSGAALLDVARLQYAGAGDAPPRLTGSFSTGGPGLPRIGGQIDQTMRGPTLIRMTMADYAAGSARLALPELVLALGGNRSLGFAGRAVLSGPLPGGSARGLVLPLDGTWSAARGLSAWRRCTAISFDALTYANLTLDRRALTLCSGPGGAILRADASGVRLAAGAPSLALSGRIGATPLRLSSGPIGFAIPGAVAARAVDVSLGPPATATRFRLSDLTARIGKDITGRFAGTDVNLFAVPLDLTGASGDWRYTGGKLTISDGDFRLVDRQAAPRFAPLVARGGTLTLIDNRIAAQAVLREPTTQRIVTAVTIAHSLADGRGHADLAVPGILFDTSLQPSQLTALALGVIANARGSVRGTGRIDWSLRGVTSSGDFTTDDLDFAAAFGPVKGASGTVHFSDLIALETPPGQTLKVASVNPGIAVEDGVVTFQLRRGQILELQGAKWPFMGGTLELRPVTMRLGVAETRRYVLAVTGLDAQKFIERMELANITARGIFDGELPLVFDENGGRIEGGVLNARAPGGTVSYVGALTYKNMGAMANFAFQALRSLDYKQMRIAMDGQLEGEILTRVRFDGVKQGTAAKRNFITQRFAKLPLQFNVNIKAPFYQLITSFKAMNDPNYVKDPRDLGLIDAAGKPIRRQTVDPPLPVLKPSDIQPPASRNMP